MKASLLFPAAFALALSLSAPTRAAVISGPELNFNGGGWIYTGIGFQALQPVTLTSFVFQNQGQADVIVLTDANGVVLQSVATPADSPSHFVSVSWALHAGDVYHLLQTVESNEKYAAFGLALPSNADIAITQSATFSYTISDFSGFGPNDYWAAFNDITTVPTVSVVPEPAGWALMLLGFGLTGAEMRRKSVARVSYR